MISPPPNCVTIPAILHSDVAAMVLDPFRFKNAHVLVVGDVMLDRYWHGGTSRISPEAPVPVVRVGTQEERPGGAANVALNIAALGAKLSLFSVVGADADAYALKQLLEHSQIACHFHASPEIQTVTKLRVLSRNQQLIRLDFETEAYAYDFTDHLLPSFHDAISSSELIVLSDYGKGVLKDPQAFLQVAIAMKKRVLVDPKQKDFSVYRGAYLVTPNLSEFEAVVGPCKTQSDLVEKAHRLRKECQFDALLITQGAEGMTLISDEGDLHVPAQTREVFDVTGAGDTVIATMAVALANQLPLERAMWISNLAAAIAVGKMGTATVRPWELAEALEKQNNGLQNRILSEDEAVQKIRELQLRKKRVVMTNGCFDILHKGHVAYLEQAKAQGDYLVVAVNSDDSVRRIKGSTRPINSCEERMAVLAGLRSVDAVVPFVEDSSERIISNLLPDVLVKGGDYTPDTVVGAQHILDRGGVVKVLSFVPGCSTTTIITRAQASSKSSDDEVEKAG